MLPILLSILRRIAVRELLSTTDYLRAVRTECRAYYLVYFYFLNGFAPTQNAQAFISLTASLWQFATINGFTHRVLAQISRRGHCSMGWFYGLKLHLVINQYGQLINFVLTPGNVADNNGAVLTETLDGLQGQCFGDRVTSLNYLPNFMSKDCSWLLNSDGA
jgi:hypothetical protein